MSDAINKTPTIEEEMSKFQGFTSVDGETRPENVPVSDKKPADEAQQPKTAAERLAEMRNGDRKPAVKDSASAQADAAEDEADEQSDAAEDEADEQSDKAAKPQRPQPKNDPNKRIAQAVGRQRAAERRAEAAERTLADLGARLARLEQGGLTQDKSGGKVAGTEDQNAPPNPADYQYGELDTRYIADVARYETRRTIEEDKARQRSDQQSAQQTQAQQALQAKMQAFEVAGLEKYPDFADVVTETAARAEWPLSPFLASLIIDSEHGPDIAYHLATDRDEAKTVSEMTPAGQARWFGRREALLSSETPGASGSPALRVSRAPEAVRRQARGNGTGQSVAPDTTDFASFERLATSKR